jgi:hypothetical protein
MPANVCDVHRFNVFIQSVISKEKINGLSPISRRRAVSATQPRRQKSDASGRQEITRNTENRKARILPAFGGAAQDNALQNPIKGRGEV